MLDALSYLSTPLWMSFSAWWSDWWSNEVAPFSRWSCPRFSSSSCISCQFVIIPWHGNWINVIRVVFLFSLQTSYVNRMEDVIWTNDIRRTWYRNILSASVLHFIPTYAIFQIDSLRQVWNVMYSFLTRRSIFSPPGDVRFFLRIFFEVWSIKPWHSFATGVSPG